MAIQKYHYELFADYFQFYLQDETVEGNLGDSWTKEAYDRLLAITIGTIGVGTVRNMTVPVDIEFHQTAPEESLAEWDQVNECSLEITSGRIVIAGCTDYFPDAARIEISPGIYRLRIYYGNLEALSDDGLEGDDQYRIVLWPGDSTPPIVLKQWPLAADRGG